MKKIILGLIFGISINAMAVLEGHYVLTKRECVSGQPPRDAFVLGRDEVKLNLHQTEKESEYTAKSRILNCQGISYGKFELKDEQYLVLKHNFIADCTTPIMPVPDSTYTYSDHGEDLVITGYNGRGGTCSEDYLKSTFTRVE